MIKFFFIIVLLSSCSSIKESESSKLRRLIANLQNELSQLKDEISINTGKIEESSYNNCEKFTSEIEKTDSNLLLFKEQYTIDKTHLESSTSGLINTIILLTNDYFQKKNYSLIEKIYSQLLENPLLKKEYLEVILYRSALINYENKKFNDSLVLFSQFYTSFSESNSKYLPSTLFHVGKIFIKLNKKNEAMEAFLEIVNKHNQNKYFTQKSKEELSNLH